MRKFFIVLLVFLCYSVWLYADEAEQQFQGFNLEGYNAEGEKAWVVNGDKADIAGSEIILTNVDADTFGEEKVNVIAKTGIVDQVSGEMRLQEDVVVTSENGQRLTTDSLDWNRDKDLVTTEDDVLITGDKMRASGTGMRAQPGLKTAEIKKDVTVVIDTDQQNAEGSQTVTITSDGPMVIDQVKSLATFEDNVVAFQNDQTLKADYMEIYFDKEMNGIKELICTGNVEIEQGENKSYAEKAVYKAGAQKLTLSGRPKLILQTEGGSLFAASGN